MNARDVVHRLEAFRSGRPIPRGSTIHLQIASDPGLLVLGLVRMGGESLPWAVGIAHPGGDPRIWSVPDARDRERVVQILAEATPHLGAHLDSPQWSRSDVTADSDPDEVPLRQIWVPNGSHVQMLHMLNLRYTFARAGDPERAAVLRSLGRLAGYLFREAGQIGQATIIDSTAALQEAFTFPADDLRQQHLGFLLALLKAKGGAEKRMAAAEAAEEKSISISLDPNLERDHLEEVVEQYVKARRADRPRTMARVERAIGEILEAEVRRRLDLALETVSLLRADERPLNAGAEKLARDSTKRRQGDYLWLEEKLAAHGEESYFPPSPVTDRDPKTAAGRYHVLASAEEAARSALIHHDDELQDEAVADGNAIRGTITKIEERAPADSRSTIPVWTVEAPSALPTRMRKGSGVALAGVPSRKGSILNVHQSNGTRRFEVEITGWKTRPSAKRHPEFADLPAAADPVLVGERIVLLPASMGGLGLRKRKRVKDNTGPGGWLTHGNGMAPKPSGGRSRKNGLLAEVEKLRLP